MTFIFRILYKKVCSHRFPMKSMPCKQSLVSQDIDVFNIYDLQSCDWTCGYHKDLILKVKFNHPLWTSYEMSQSSGVQDVVFWMIMTS